MLSSSVVEKLNQQIQREAFASNAYLGMATWAESRNLSEIATYFYNASNDERNHMLEIYRYINAHGGEARLGEVKAFEGGHQNLLQVFEAVFDLEHSVTVAINELVAFVQSEKDFATFQFLQAFVTEQQDSERSVNDIIQMIKTLGFDERNAYFINKHFRRINTAQQTAETSK